jgi:hypothetical protein
MKLLTENTKSTLQLVIPIIVAIIGVGQYIHGQKMLSEHESRQRLEQKKFEVYFKIGEYMGAIISHANMDSSFQKDLGRFYGLYYGEALLLDDSAVDKTITAFRFACRDYMLARLTKSEFTQKGFELADTLRSSIKQLVQSKNND